MNNKYTIEVKEPLIRLGITITTEVSERYVTPVVTKVMELVREINGTKEDGNKSQERTA